MLKNLGNLNSKAHAYFNKWSYANIEMTKEKALQHEVEVSLYYIILFMMNISLKNFNILLIYSDFYFRQNMNFSKVKHKFYWFTWRMHNRTCWRLPKPKIEWKRLREKIKLLRNLLKSITLTIISLKKINLRIHNACPLQKMSPKRKLCCWRLYKTLVKI